MARFDEPFDASEVEDVPEYQDIEDGLYIGLMVLTERHSNARNTGDYLKIDFAVHNLKGEDVNRETSTYLNLWHTKNSARKISRVELREILEKSNLEKTRLEDSDELVGASIGLFLFNEEYRNRNGEIRNALRIGRYLSRSEMQQEIAEMRAEVASGLAARKQRQQATQAKPPMSVEPLEEKSTRVSISNRKPSLTDKEPLAQPELNEEGMLDDTIPF